MLYKSRASGLLSKKKNYTLNLITNYYAKLPVDSPWYYILQIPICSSTGGLVDTVKEGVTGFHMGSFNAEVKNDRLGLSDWSQMSRC